MFYPNYREQISCAKCIGATTENFELYKEIKKLAKNERWKRDNETSKLKDYIEKLKVRCV